MGKDGSVAGQGEEGDVGLNPNCQWVGGRPAENVESCKTVPGHVIPGSKAHVHAPLSLFNSHIKHTFKGEIRIPQLQLQASRPNSRILCLWTSPKPMGGPA